MLIPHKSSAALGRNRIQLGPEIVAAILHTVITGWQRACANLDVNAQAGEVRLTERLRDGMRNQLKALPWNFIVLPGTESRSRSDVLIPDGRTDIPLMLIEIFLRTEEHDPHAIIECKRIAGSDTHLCREYVVEGVDRFASGKYGENHSVGFMVGYVLFGTAADSVSGVNAYLVRGKRTVDCLVPCDICSPAASWSSSHLRAKPVEPIHLHHAFLGMA